jgi:hypothetical protein
VKLGFLVTLAVLPLSGQAPPGWFQQDRLGAGIAQEGFWHGAGLWAGDHHGPVDTLGDSLGLGNGLTGGGFHLEGGYRRGHWDVAAEALGDRGAQGQAFLTLYRSHLWYQGDRGWQGGFEQEPLVWGYGLNGGYLLGEAARPFPRVRVESPMADLHLLRVPLGSWAWQAFLGRMESHPVVSASLQNPSWTRRAIASQGDPEAPLLMGYRVQAQFGPLMEFYADDLTLWSGTLNGRGMTSGYGLGDYLTAMFGLKDAFAEGNSDFSNPNPPVAQFVNQARSASEVDVGFRLQAPFIAGLVGADRAYAYVSRGSKDAVWPIGVFIRNPPRYLYKDVAKDLDNAFLHPNLGSTWNQNSRYAAPSLAQPNDTVGVLAAWPGVRAGLEYYGGVNAAISSFRPFTHGTYLTGFYYDGDPLGEALGGEADCATASLEVDCSDRLASATRLLRGFRPFRDNLVDWQADHPGQVPGKNRFTGLQQTLSWKQNPVTTWTLHAAWQRQQAVENVAGLAGNGFAWAADVTFRWPAGS